MEEFERFAKLSEAELIGRINRELPEVPQLSLSFLYDELHRRREVESSRRIEAMTVAIKRLTVSVVVLTVAAVVVAIVGLVIAS